MSIYSTLFVPKTCVFKDECPDYTINNPVCNRKYDSHRRYFDCEMFQNFSDAMIHKMSKNPKKYQR